METFPQCIVNVFVKEKKDLESVPAIKKSIDAAEAKLNGKGRILVRYSGTQPICRIMVEGQTKGEIVKIANEMAEIIKGQLN
jgi:phosphoglucosamine mutase